MNNSFKWRSIYFFPIALVICVILYYPTREYGIVTDYLGWLNKYRAGSWVDLKNCFGYKGLHQVFHFLNYCIYKAVGANLIALYLLFCLGHATVVYLIYIGLRDVSSWLGYSDGKFISVFAALCVLVSPYSAEVVTWKACLHYMMATGMTFLCIIFLLKYDNTKRKSWLIGHFIWFGLSLFTIELTLVSPGIFGMLFLAKWLLTKNGKTLQRGLKISLIHGLMLIIYLALTKIMIGDYVGHYGAERHLNFSPSLLIGTTLQYLSKYLFAVHYFSFASRTAWYQSLAHGMWLWIPSIIIVAMLLVAILKQKTSWTTFGFMVISFLIALLPVMNLYFMYINQYENDRYGYYASPWIYFAIMMVFHSTKSRLKYVFMTSFLGLQLYLLLLQVNNINQAGTLLHDLVKSFPCDSKDILVLSTPDNYKGMYMLRDYSDDGVVIHESMDWLTNTSCSARIKVVSSYNGIHLGSHLTGSMDSLGQITVWNIAGGSWFIRKGIGMSSYQNESVEVDLRSGHFIAKYKHLNPDTKVIFPDGGSWKEADKY